MSSDMLRHVLPCLLAIAEGCPTLVSDDEVMAALQEDLTIHAKTGSSAVGRGRVLRLTDFARGGSNTNAFGPARCHYLHVAHGLEMDEGQSRTQTFWTDLVDQGQSNPMRNSSPDARPQDWSDASTCVRVLRAILGLRTEIRAAVSLVANSWGSADDAEGVIVALSTSGTTGEMGICEL